VRVKILKFEDYLILVLIVFSLIIFPILKQSQLATYGLIPATFLYFLFNDIRRKKTPNHKFFNLFIIFFLWGVFTSIWSIDLNLAIRTQRRILIIILYIYSIISYVSKSERNVLNALKAHILVLVILQIYVFIIRGIEEVDFAYNVQEQFEFNSNTYGYFIFIGIFSGFMLYLNTYSKKFYRILLIILAIGSSIILLLTASRGGFIIFGMSIFLGLIAFVKNQKRISLGFIFRVTFLLLVTYFLVIYFFENFFNNTYLYARFFQLEEYTSPRTLHFYEAIKVGWNHPFGVGGGNYALVPRSFEQGSFSHNGLTEAFANYGFIGLLLYLGLFLEYFKQLRRISKSKIVFDQRIINFHYVFLLIFLSYNIFYVPYLTLEFMGIFIIFRLHLNYVKFNISQYENNNNSK